MKESIQGHRNRLRKRFRKSSFQGFNDYEVLEYLLTFAIPRKDTKPLAKELIKRFGSLPGVMDTDPELLQEIDGIGPKSADFISAVREASRIYSEDSLIGREISLDSPEAVVKHIRAILFSRKEELFMALFLSAKNKVLGIQTISKGTIDQAVIYPRKLFEAAMKNNAAGLILVHNHPSGDSAPSKDDIAITKRLSGLAKELDITLHDHIIIGSNNSLSFKQEEIL